MECTAKNFDGGQVDITSGKFVFSANEAYLIKDGKITTPIKGATLIGSGDEVLHQISMVGDDLNLDPGIGTCGKEGQSVPVGVGQPSLKVDNDNCRWHQLGKLILKSVYFIDFDLSQIIINHI
jgi:TldD protein